MRIKFTNISKQKVREKIQKNEKMEWKRWKREKSTAMTNIKMEMHIQQAIGKLEHVVNSMRGGSCGKWQIIDYRYAWPYTPHLHAP